MPRWTHTREEWDKYYRLHREADERHLEYLKEYLGPTHEARTRSMLLHNKWTSVRADGPGKRKWARKEPRQEPQWVVHVRDGVAVTEHGAELLKKKQGEHDA